MTKDQALAECFIKACRIARKAAVINNNTCPKPDDFDIKIRKNVYLMWDGIKWQVDIKRILSDVCTIAGAADHIMNSN